MSFSLYLSNIYLKKAKQACLMITSVFCRVRDRVFFIKYNNILSAKLQNVVCPKFSVLVSFVIMIEKVLRLET